MAVTSGFPGSYSLDRPGPTLDLTSVGKIAIWFSFLSTTFFCQIAINIKEFPASTDLFVYAIFTVYLVSSGVARTGVVALFVFLLWAVVAAARIFTAVDASSFTSFLLLFALYVPFHFRLMPRPNLQNVQDYAQRVFVTVAIVISLIAVAQLILVNGLKLNVLKNISYLLPDEIRAAGIYRFDREDAGVVKANGFFLREASTLSIVTAIAILVEYFSNARKLVLGILAAGLLASISGSGVFIILVGLGVPTSLRRTPSFLLVVSVVAFLLFFAEDIPGLSLWADRLSEFSKEGSSGYARYIAPFEMVQHGFNQGVAETWFGNGGGSYLRTMKSLRRPYEINDPTWAKLIYEYGVVGFTVIVGVFVSRLYSSRLRPEICNAILFAWASAANVLKPEYVLAVWVLTLVPKMKSPRARVIDARPATTDSPQYVVR